MVALAIAERVVPAATGASLDVDAHPDATFTSMAAFADDAVPA